MHSVQSRVFVTVGCPSVSLLVPSAAAAGLLLWAQRQGRSRRSGHGLTTFSATKIYFSILCLLKSAIQFKIAVLTYRVLHGNAPRYLEPLTSTVEI